MELYRTNHTIIFMIFLIKIIYINPAAVASTTWHSARKDQISFLPRCNAEGEFESPFLDSDALGQVKNRKQVTNWMWIIVDILGSESCNLGLIANCLPMETKAESRVTLIRRWLSNSQVNVRPFYKKGLEHVLSGWSSVEVDLILDGVMVFGDRW